MAYVSRCILLLICALHIKADDIDRGLRKGVMLKLLREMVNQTKADTLNLPANATSIRENIVDTFSCENRTYGYYADVDNECQVFHVCLTTQGASGRNATYRWSFICPNETIFNQEVLTCTRPRDSINCEDSPMYYDLNMEIGKMPDDTQSSNDTNKNSNEKPPKPNKETSRIKDKRKQTNRKKQNIIVENLMKEVEEMEEQIGELNEELLPIVEEPVHEVGEEYEMQEDKMEGSRLVSERSLKRGRKMRGSYRYKDGQ